MLARPAHVAEVRRLLTRFPVVGLLGARQVGKTTLALQICRAFRGGAHRFDLENPVDLQRLSDPMLALGGLRGLIVIDEIHRRPELFPVLRVLADRPRSGVRILVLGSASPGLLRQSSESLAGRIAYHPLPGFSIAETGVARLERLWLRGGFPRSYLARGEGESLEWRRQFITTFLERDLPQFGVRIEAVTLRRFWSMLAHMHGQIWNAAEISRSLGVTAPAVRGYLDLLCSTFVVRELKPWHENLAKRQVKAPKVYVADSGILHALLNLPTMRDLEGHARIGASWEGFMLEEVARRLGARPDECWFWATHQGAELDLLVVRGRRRLGFEFKRSSAPFLTPSMRIAMQDLRLDELVVVHAGAHGYSLAPRVRAVGAHRIGVELPSLK